MKKVGKKKRDVERQEPSSLKRAPVVQHLAFSSRSTGSLSTALPAASVLPSLPSSTALPRHRRPSALASSSTRHRRSVPGPSLPVSGESLPWQSHHSVFVRE